MIKVWKVTLKGGKSWMLNKCGENRGARCYASNFALDAMKKFFTYKPGYVYSISDAEARKIKRRLYYKAPKRYLESYIGVYPYIHVLHGSVEDPKRVILTHWPSEEYEDLEVYAGIVDPDDVVVRYKSHIVTRQLEIISKVA